MQGVAHYYYLQRYDFGFDKPKQIRVEAHMLLKQVQPPLQTDLFLQGTMEVFDWTLYVNTSLLALFASHVCTLTCRQCKMDGASTANLRVREVKQLPQLITLLFHSAFPCASWEGVVVARADGVRTCIAGQATTGRGVCSCLSICS